jgi:hypothetical protein
MEITLIFIVFLIIGLFLWIGYKGSKDSKNKPPQIK